MPCFLLKHRITMCQYRSLGPRCLTVAPTSSLISISLSLYPDMSTEHTWRKLKLALSQFSSPVELHFGTFAAMQNWTTPCRGQSTIFQVKTLKGETCTEAQDYCTGKLISHLMHFSFFFLFFVCEGAL